MPEGLGDEIPEVANPDPLPANDDALGSAGPDSGDIQQLPQTEQTFGTLGAQNALTPPVLGEDSAAASIGRTQMQQDLAPPDAFGMAQTGELGTAQTGELGTAQTGDGSEYYSLPGAFTPAPPDAFTPAPPDDESEYSSQTDVDKPLRDLPTPSLYDQLHSNPPGPSLRIGQLSWDTDPQTLRDMQPEGRMGNLVWTMPAAPVEVLNATAAVSAMEAQGRADPGTQPYWAQQDARDEGVARAAATLHGQFQLPGWRRGKAMLDDTDRVLTGPSINTKMDGAGELLSQHDGIVIAGGHGQDMPWDFLTYHMKDLHDAGVRTIYSEDLRDDGHQGMLNEYLRAGRMHLGLHTFLSHYDNSGLYKTVAAARTAGIHVQGYGGRPARRPARKQGDSPEEGLHARAALLNTYGAQVVQQHQADNPGKYVMVTGAAHGTTHPGPDGGATVRGVTIPANFPGLGDILNVPVVQTNAADPLRFSQLIDGRATYQQQTVSTGTGADGQPAEGSGLTDWTGGVPVVQPDPDNPGRFSQLTDEPDPTPFNEPDPTPFNEPDATPFSTDATPFSTDATPFSTDATPFSEPDATPFNEPDATPFSTDATPFNEPDATPFSTDATPFNEPDATPLFSTPDATPFSTPDATPFSTPDATPFSTPDATPLTGGAGGRSVEAEE